MPVIPIPVTVAAPQHIAIVMDGNRRWASQRSLPKAIGHASGARRVRNIVQACSERGIRYLTLFAFSTENWSRPMEEVSSLMGLFVHYLEKEVTDMNAHGVRLKVVGDLSAFDARLQRLMRESQEKTAHNTRITLTIAANYGGRWDMLQATRAWMSQQPADPCAELTEQNLRPYFSMAYAPDPDLVIRTGGESRISNFLLWQMAYSELYFTDTLWPDFTAQSLDQAIQWFHLRDRRFGGTPLKASR
ncbi:polyprenyl diphosphate synthase [Hydrogenophaga sp.]|uniref:polyprenyl diphosphate synthase n=1 Tax=Hydrogenophaga sp. TaxID=1904254 RepID=UPI0019BD6CE5|nr:polyprenyl diphosphate synthase [Hydrogenophaga sp.]MBD3894144.1 di-trans,poly-cis-decaprenylcistransferase [Hydrogenophaga sp.]